MAGKSALKKRLLHSIVFAVIALIAVVVVNFFLPRLMPGDPVMSLIGAEEDDMTQEDYDYYYHALGLDKPMAEQFGDYMKGLFSGDLGYAYHYGRDVSEVVSEKIPNTLQIALPALIISALLAYFLGTAAGYRRAKLGDTAITGTMIVFNAVPTFLMAMVMVILFAYVLRWLPFGGLNSTVTPQDPFLAFADRLKHLILPIATLVLTTTPTRYLLMRNTTASALDEKYVVYAKAKGLSGHRIRTRHIFTNVAQPFISMLGTSFGKMLSGSIIIEMIFSIDGMGMLINQAINQRDFAVLQACLFIIAVMVVLANLLTDIICALVDPRQRLGENYGA